MYDVCFFFASSFVFARVFFVDGIFIGVNIVVFVSNLCVVNFKFFCVFVVEFDVCVCVFIVCVIVLFCVFATRGVVLIVIIFSRVYCVCFIVCCVLCVCVIVVM